MRTGGMASASAGAGSLPVGAGIGLRSPHVAEVLATRPALPWLEVHPENYLGGGPAARALDALRRDYPVTFHAVGLSVGSADGVDRRHLDRIRRLVDRVEPALVSEHLAWSQADGAYLNHLLPLPYTEESLAVVCRNVDEVQTVLGRRVLVENPSAYLRFTASTIPEAEFLAELARRTGCGLLCDVNNVHVTAQNLALDPDRLPGRPAGRGGRGDPSRRAFGQRRRRPPAPDRRPRLAGRARGVAPLRARAPPIRRRPDARRVGHGHPAAGGPRGGSPARRRPARRGDGCCPRCLSSSRGSPPPSSGRTRPSVAEAVVADGLAPSARVTGVLEPRLHEPDRGARRRPFPSCAVWWTAGSLASRPTTTSGASPGGPVSLRVRRDVPRVPGGLPAVRGTSLPGGRRAARVGDERRAPRGGCPAHRPGRSGKSPAR